MGKPSMRFSVLLRISSVDGVVISGGISVVIFNFCGGWA